LSKLGLPVGAQILVPETAGELIVSPEAAGHEHLLVLLGTLRQSVCETRPSGGNEKLPRALRGGFEQDGGLDLGEGELVERFPELEGYLGANDEASAERIGEADLKMARRGGELDVLGNDDILGEDIQGLDARQVEIDTEHMAREASGT
jgi:hypothetical protein